MPSSQPSNLTKAVEFPATFTDKKARILDSLAIPDAEYLDKSPKGSVDAGIRDLIAELNAYPGLVTTSSCAGRVSVFVEGREDGGTKGGKGGGKWLFVNHEPVATPESFPGSVSGGDGVTGREEGETGVGSWTSLFGLVPPTTVLQKESPESRQKHHTTSPPRLIRLSFEPLILHVLCASLSHARPLLSAAIAAGFRESGLQSLKNLDDADACPMVAVRSAGLGFESVIGRVSEVEEGEGATREVYEAVVGEEYLEMVMRVVRRRFGGNETRRERFREELRGAMGWQKGMKNGEDQHQSEGGEWEDAESRRARKREEGLRRQLEKRECWKARDDVEVASESDGVAGLLMD